MSKKRQAPSGPLKDPDRRQVRMTFSLDGEGCQVRVGVDDVEGLIALSVRDGSKEITVALEGADALRLGSALLEAFGTDPHWLMPVPSDN